MRDVGKIPNEHPKWIILDGDVDPDCDEGPPQDSDWVPDDYILRLCGDIDAGDRFLGLAETLCSEWIDNPTAYPQCLEACIAANEEG